MWTGGNDGKWTGTCAFLVYLNTQSTFLPQGFSEDSRTSPLVHVYAEFVQHIYT